MTMHERFRKPPADENGIIRKETSGEVRAGNEYVLSDGSVDRYGEIVEPAGWKLAHFKRNPIALFGHNAGFPIGNWSNVRVEGGRLVGKLDFAAAGTSERIDEIRRLAEQKVLRAVSVGFRPLKSVPMNPKADPDDWWEPQKYLENDLLECSLVSIPANPNALQAAFDLHVSKATIDLVFGVSADRDQLIRRRGLTGVPAARSPISRNTTMETPLSAKITTLQAEQTAERDILLAETAKEDPNDDVVTEFTASINGRTARLDRLIEAERALAAQSTPAAGTTDAPADPRRPYAVAAKKVEPREYVYRGLAAMVKGHYESRPAAVVLEEQYGQDPTTRAIFGAISRAASAPAMTTTTGWAAELVQTAILDFIESLTPNSVYPRLSGIGGRFAFGENGIVSLPSRSATPNLAGAFVAQGAPIPVKQGAFTATTLNPKKMAVITTLTREMAEHSVPALEGVLRQAIQEDTAVAIDTVLLDATVADAIRPSGLRNGVTVTTATAGGTFTALVGDVKALLTKIVTGSAGQLRNPVWIMNPIQAIAIGLTQNAGGDFPFAAQIERGTLQGYPLIQSTTVTAGMVLLVDAADFFSAVGDEPKFSVSDQATLHMEDTTPLPIASGAQGSGVLATPARSLFQTDSIAIRMILDMNWALRRTGTVAWTQSVTW